MADGDTTVYLARSGFSEAYHTDRDCQYIRDMDDGDIREATPAAVEPHKSVCTACAEPLPHRDESKGGPSEVYQRAKQAGEDGDHLERVRDV